MEAIPLLLIYGGVAWLIAAQAKRRGFSWSKYFWVNLVLGAIGWIVSIFMWRSDRAKSLNSYQSQSGVPVKPAQRLSSTGAPDNGFIVPKLESYSFGVVGESNYLPAIRTIVANGGGAEECFVLASLEPEPGNRHDRNAIRVVIRGATVGYIARTDTAIIHPVIQRLASQGKKLLCHARVFYGPSYGEELVGSVNLDLPYDLSLIVPANSLPTSGRLWPAGSRLQVSLDPAFIEEAQSVLERAYQDNRVSVYCGLVVEPSDRGNDLVAVSIDGRKCGNLSPASSKKYSGLISRVIEEGPIYSRAVISGNRLAVNLHLLMKRPEDLSSDEIAGLGL
jgi:hypothetical protein